jgi:hypothetical protein
MTKQEAPKTPKELDAIADFVLAYKPKAKTKSAKKRKKRASILAATSHEEAKRKSS